MTLTRLAADPRTLTILRWGLGLLMLWAAVSKLANLTSFLGSVYAYDLPLPKGGLKIVAVVLPWVELLCGLLLIGAMWMETSIAVAGGLFAVFLLATGQAWARGLNISCGCFDLSIFGLDKDHSKVAKYIESPGFAFVRNLALSTVVLLLYNHAKGAPKLDSKLLEATESARGPQPSQVDSIKFLASAKKRREAR